MRSCLPLVLLAWLLAAPGPAAAGKPTKPAAPPTAKAKAEQFGYASLLRLPQNVTLATLSNGLTVIVQENHMAAVATVRSFVKNTGSAYESKNLGAGLSHVLEHVVAGGSTSHRTEKEIEQLVDTFGGATNAATSTDMTTFFIDCPAKNAMAAIELIADAMQHVKFEPSEFARELTVVRRELADDEVDRRHVLWKLLSQTVYTTHPARHPIVGYLDVLNATTNQTIMDFYHERYVPNNQIFVVAGDVDTQRVLDQVAKQYAGTLRSRETYVPFEDEPEQLSPREAVTEMDGATYDLALAWPTVKLSHPDLYPLDVAAYILGEGESSRLVERLKYEKQVVLSVGAMSDTPHYVAGFFAATAVSRPKTWQRAEREILREVYRLRDELVSPTELAKAKKQKAAELIFSRQTAKQAAEGLGRNFLATGDPLYEQTYVEGIQKVTAEQVREVARRYFVPQRLNRVIIAPPGGAPKSTEKAAKATEGEIRSVRLPNGLRVLLKRQGQLPLVNIQAFVRAGSLADDAATAGRARWRRPCSTWARPIIRPHRLPSTSIRSGDIWPSTPGGSPCSAAPRRCGTIFPRPPRCSPSVSRGRPFPKTSMRRCNSLPWAPSPAAPTTRTRKSTNSSATTCRPARPTTSFQAASCRPCENSRPKTCSSTTPDISCRTT